VVCLLKEGWLSSQLKHCGLEVFIVPQHRSFDFIWLRRLGHLVYEEKVDLIHAHEFTMNTYGCIASVMAKIPMVATVHGRNYYTEKLRRRLAYRFVSRRSSMIAVSKGIKLFLIERAGIKEERVTVIYNGIDAKVYQQCKDPDRVRKEFGINGRGPVIGTLGNLYPVKGHTYLLRAAREVVRFFPKATFLIAGRGALLDHLQEEAAKLNIQQNVKFLGFREDIPQLLQVMDLFVLPSLSEGLPVSLLEAMAAGKPVIATQVGGNPEVVIEAETGFLVPAGDPVSLSERIISLLRNPNLAERMGEAGRSRVEKDFGLNAMLEKYQQIYEDSLH
jgi:glycosyltransferase involved in cell wall biosynthesis